MKGRRAKNSKTTTKDRDGTDDALAAIRLLADKLAAVATMHYLFNSGDAFNATLRALTAATPGTSSSMAGDGSTQQGSMGGGSRSTPPRPASGGRSSANGSTRLGGQGTGAPGPGVAGGGGGGGVEALPLQGGPSPGESGTQNSASSMVELAAIPADAGSSAARLDLCTAVEQYMALSAKWATAASANEKFIEAMHRRPDGTAAARHVGALLLAVGFEAGMWDLPAVLHTAKQACAAIMDIVQEQPGHAGRAAVPAAIPQSVQ